MSSKPWRKPLSDFSWSLKPDGTVHILDHNRGGMSVTNDAENVLASIDKVMKLYHHRNLADVPKITYADSEGQIDRLLWDGEEFLGFQPGPDQVLVMSEIIKDMREAQ